MFQYSFANVDLMIEDADFAGNKSGIPSSFRIESYPTGNALIKAARMQATATMDFSAYGEGVVSMHRIKAGTLAFPVLAYGQENVWLSEWVNYFQSQADSDGQPVKPLSAIITDNMGNDTVRCSGGVILGHPLFSRGQQAGTNEWVFTFNLMEFDLQENLGTIQ